MSFDFRRRGVAVGIGSVILVACSALAVIQAQVTSSDGESRLPKGIRGLEDGQTRSPSANWLLDAKNDAERFRRIQIHAGGTDQQMWQQVYHAIIDENWELGLYHWTKLRDVFNVALMKRPKRTPNAEAMFLDSAWKQLDDALRAKDPNAGRCRTDRVDEICSGNCLSARVNISDRW